MTPIDVFIRTTRPANTLREAMFQVSMERWRIEPVRVVVMVNHGVREGRRCAEEQAISDPYIYTDNDVLIVGKDWVKRAVEAILSHPEYRAVSSLSLVEGENLAKGEGEIYEMHAVGAPMIIRKGTMVDLPEMDLGSECGVIHKMILDRGGKEGLLGSKDPTPLRHLHLGHGFSSNPALHWGV